MATGIFNQRQLTPEELRLIQIMQGRPLAPAPAPVVPSTAVTQQQRLREMSIPQAGQQRLIPQQPPRAPQTALGTPMSPEDVALAARATAGAPQAPALANAMEPSVAQEQSATPPALVAAMMSQSPGGMGAGPMSRVLTEGSQGYADPMRNNAVYEGALQAGVGLLANTADPAKALAAGFRGFGQGYDTREAADRAKNTPKITPIGDGTAAIYQYADGRTEVKQMPEVQDAKLAQLGLKGGLANQKAAEKKAVESRALRSSYEGMVEKSGIVNKKITQALGQVDWTSAGFANQLTGWIGGTPGANLDATIDTLMANSGFEELQKMRLESPTGGALGQVAVKELERLESVKTSLKTNQKPSQLKQHLTEYQDIMANRTLRLKEAYARDVSEGRIPAGSIPQLEDTATPRATQGPGATPGFEKSSKYLD